MSVRRKGSSPLPVSGDARFFALLQHQGQVLHRIGLAALHIKQPEIVNSGAQFGAIYESIDKALTIYLKTKLKIKNSDFKNEVIQIKLEQMNVEKNTVDLLFEIFENCQLARYTPLNIDAMSDDYNKTKQFIEQLEKY